MRVFSLYSSIYCKRGGNSSLYSQLASICIKPNSLERGLTCFILLRINEKELGRQIWKFTKRSHLPFSGGHLNYMSHQIEIFSENKMLRMFQLHISQLSLVLNTSWELELRLRSRRGGAPKRRKIGKSKDFVRTGVLTRYSIGI